jgi:hypothetical protein
MVGRPELNVNDVYPLVLAGRGLHFTVKSVLDRVPCPGLVAVQVVDMPNMVRSRSTIMARCTTR